MASPDHPSRHTQRSINVDDATWRALRQHALAEGVPATKIVEQLIRRYIAYPPALIEQILTAVRADGGAGEDQ